MSLSTLLPAESVGSARVAAAQMLEDPARGKVAGVTFQVLLKLRDHLSVKP